jgi:cytochrome bd ubiquinol oxidase subunit I
VVVTLSIIVVLYALLGTATVLILRMLARRWRSGETEEVSVPYGPSLPRLGPPEVAA